MATPREFVIMNCTKMTEGSDGEAGEEDENRGAEVDI